MDQRMMKFIGGGVLSFMISLGWAENVFLPPTGDLWQSYDVEERKLRASIGRWVDFHCQSRDLLKESHIEVEYTSFIWHAPYFGHADFASVFWNTNQIVVVTLMQKNFVVKEYLLSKEMFDVKERWQKQLENYHFVYPLGGDGNVSEVGVFADGSLTRVFSLQTGYCFKKSKKKFFCGSKDSVAAYECMVAVDDFLRKVQQKGWIKEIRIPFSCDKE